MFDAIPAAPKMVISQIYGAGGNSGALVQNDYVELFNAGTATATLTGWSVQYASATGTGAFGVTNQIATLSGTVAPGQYYLVKLAGGATGTPLPAADATSNIAMAAGAGKVALVDQATSLGCNGSSTPCSAAQLAHIIDLVGYGNANFYEGSGPAPTLSGTLAGFRAGSGCTDTNNNSADFSTGTPAPRNSSTTIPPCGGSVVVPVIDHVVVEPDEATVAQGSSTQFTAKAYDAAAQEIASATFTWSSSNGNATVSSTGIATGEQAGDALIIAISENGKADTATLHVEAIDPPPAIRFSEIHYDNSGNDFNEALEIEGPAGTDVTGWTIVLYNGNGGAVYGEERVFDGLIPATTACNGRGVIVVTYPADGLQNGSPDGFALVDASGIVVEFLSYEGIFTANGGPADGMTSKDVGVAQTSAPVGQSLQRSASGATWASAVASFGVCNGTGVTPPPFPNSISFSGRTPGDAPLPVGFEDQLFATLRNGAGTVIPTTFVWSSETPAIASIDQDGVMRALAGGTAIFRATAEDGTTRRYSLPMHVATASPTAHYDGNAEFGEPADDTPADELIIRRNELISSFNVNRGIPNWVAYEVDASHFGPSGTDRCDCFTYDPELPQTGRYTTADYTGAGGFHGYGIDRGHLARSRDRTAGTLDNARTFYFSNIIPQAADNNQGPWAIMENYLGGLAESSAKEVYVIAGPAGSKGTIKNEGKIVLPTHTWKVAVIMPKDQGIEHVNSYDDVEVIAVIMPNEPGIRNVDWRTYETTVDAVEALSGYDLLALLRDDIEIAVESNTKPPVAAVDGPYTGIEGEEIDMSASMSSDADGDALTFAWRFGDGGSATGVNVSHTYTRGGTFTVRLIATDTRALSDTVETTAAIATWSQATGSAGAVVGQLANAGKLNRGIANSLHVKLDAAENQFRSGNNTAAVNQLEAFIHELDALIQSGRLSAADAAQLRALVTRIILAAS